MIFSRYITLLVVILPLWVFASIPVRILDIHDGDTLTAIGVEDKTKYKIRLLGVDAPETDFFGHSQDEAGAAAKAALLKMLPIGSYAQIADDGPIDKHRRVLGRIFKDGEDINERMLLEGWGYFYFIAPFSKRVLMDYSIAAQMGVESKNGLFSQNPPLEPYLFRLRVRKQQGQNFIGDIETKTLVAEKDLAQIPLWRRVFFPDEQSAKNLGYR